MTEVMNFETTDEVHYGSVNVDEVWYMGVKLWPTKKDFTPGQPNFGSGYYYEYSYSGIHFTFAWTPGWDGYPGLAKLYRWDTGQTITLMAQFHSSTTGDMNGYWDFHDPNSKRNGARVDFNLARDGGVGGPVTYIMYNGDRYPLSNPDADYTASTSKYWADPNTPAWP